MKIKKIEHCCLLIEIGGITILTDPGVYSAEQNKLTGIDVVLITHKHGDHFHAETVEVDLGDFQMCGCHTHSVQIH